MGSPLIWFGNAAKLLKSKLTIPGSTSGAVSVQAPAAVTDYTVTLPPAQGANGQVMTNNGSGVLSWSTPAPAYTQATIANNQVAPADVTGFLLDKALTQGFSAEYSIVRNYTSPASGALFTSFNTNTGTGADGFVRSIAVNPASGLIFIGGEFATWNGTARNYATFLNPDGTENTSMASAINTGTGFDSFVLNAAYQSTGKLVVVGQFTNWNGNGAGGIVRFNADGTEDTVFTTNIGTALASLSIWTVAVQPDDKIIIGGTFTSFNGSTHNRIMRLNADGTADTSFNTNLSTAADSTVYAIAVQSTGKIVVGGAFTSFGGVSNKRRIVRLNSDGTEDTAFYTAIGGSGGTSGANGAILTLANQSDDSVVVGGQFTTFGTDALNYLARITSSGAKDTAFNSNFAGALNGYDSSVEALAIQQNGAILIGGNFTTYNGSTRYYLNRLNSDGTEDTAFYTAFGSALDGDVYAIGLTSAEAVILGGGFVTINTVTVGYLGALSGSSSVLVQEGTIRGIYRPWLASWQLAGPVSIGDDAGVSLNILGNGQVQYTSTNLSGTAITNNMRFILTKL